jgi:hypothetical protein
MFGFSGGESVPVVARKRRYLNEAQQRWPFLTNYDASTVKAPQQLVTMLKERSSLPRADAERDVIEWMAGKDFRIPMQGLPK